MDAKTTASENPALDKAKQNNARAHRVRFLRTQNLQLATELEETMASHSDTILEMVGYDQAAVELNDMRDHQKHVLKLISNLRGCCSQSLFKVWHDGQAAEYVASHTCKSKICLVCNSDKKRKVRRKYWNWANDQAAMLADMNFMHLTLTVPHSAQNGWRGVQVYSSELLAAFNVMRKYDWWKELVAGGEFNVEFTRNESGFHCHIHALLLVPDVKGSRNLLHSRILPTWNSLTMDPASTRQEFDADQLAGIQKSIRYLDPAGQARIIDRLDPRGSTLIGLESLYTWQKVDGQPVKKYIDQRDPRQLGAGLMECLKYHFEPLCLKKSDKTWDIRLIYDLAPAIYRKVLHGRFGILRAFKELSISGKDPVQDMIDDVKETGGITYNPITGEESERAEYNFHHCDILRVGKRTDILKVYTDPGTDPIMAEGVVDAFKQMLDRDLLFKKKQSKSLKKSKSRNGNTT